MTKKTQRRLGILTSGGDCPGLNAAIRAIVKTAEQNSIQVIGVEDGFEGFINKKFRTLTSDQVSGILELGGTCLFSSRFNPFLKKSDIKKLEAVIRQKPFDALVVIGGEGSLRLAHEVSLKGMSIIGIPKTIDNDVWGTDKTIGFDTAVQTVVTALDQLRTTATSHHSVMIVEVMGRHSGQLAVTAGLAGGADLILTPEYPLDLEEVMIRLKNRRARGKKFSLIVVAEAAMLTHGNQKINLATPLFKDQHGTFKSSGTAVSLANLIVDHTSLSTRVVILGHVQRGGSPVASDRNLATSLGIYATHLFLHNNFNQVVVIKKGKVTSIPLSSTTHPKKKLSKQFYETADSFI